MVTKLLGLEGSFELVASNDKELLKKSLTGRFPYMVLDNGLVICEHVSIARVLSKNHPIINGVTQVDQQQVDMWIDYINSQVVPASKKVIAQCNGLNKPSMDLR